MNKPMSIGFKVCSLAWITYESIVNSRYSEYTVFNKNIREALYYDEKIAGPPIKRRLSNYCYTGRSTINEHKS